MRVCGIRVAWLVTFLFSCIAAGISAQSTVPSDSTEDSVQQDSRSNSSYRSFSMDTIRFSFDWTTLIDRSLQIGRSMPPSRLEQLGDFRPIDLDSAFLDEPSDSIRHAIYMAVRWRHYWRDMCAEIRFPPDSREYYEQFRLTRPNYVKGSLTFNALQ